ncbi:MAG: helix-turn-helix domain-containing protein [Bdellovibrionales bacterium]
MLNKGLGRIDPKTRKVILEHVREFSSVLQAQRKKMGLTQEALAEKLDISVNTVKYIEQGRRLPSLVMILKIAVALKLRLTLQKIS